MSIDRSLKTANALTRHRNVLTRAERIAKLKDLEKWEEGKSPFGLPKVANRNLKVGKKTKKAEEGAEGAAAAAPAAGAAAAPAKGAAKK
jgi:small basic protein (TIGR04137 family)